MIRLFTYNVFKPAAFPYKNGMQEISGVPVLIVQGIFTEGGKKHPDFACRENSGYRLLSTGLSAEDTIIGFFGKESSGGIKALDLILEDQERIGFKFRPLFCRHVDVLSQAKLIQRRIPYTIFIDCEDQCFEPISLEDLLLGEVARSIRH